MDKLNTNNKVTNKNKSNDRVWLLTIVGILLLIGTFTIFSCTQMLDFLNPYSYIKKHLLINVPASLILFFIATKINYKSYKKYAFILFIITFILLICPSFCRAIKGAHRWITLGPLSFQPSELAQLIIVIVMADFLERKKDKINEWENNLFPVIYIGLFCGITILFQRDLGTTLLLAVIWTSLLALARIDFQRFLIIGFSSIFFGIIAIIVEPYRIRRIIDSINSHSAETASKIGYNLKASLAAFGSGGLLGKGPGQSDMKLQHLPEMQTDFIFPIFGEEYGLIGTLFVVGLYIALLNVILSINKNCKDDFGKFLSFGILLILMIHTITNMAMTIGIIPAKGFPLPFVSYGGTSLMINCIMIGILYNIARNNNN